MFEQSLNPNFYGNTIRWIGRIEQTDSWQKNHDDSLISNVNEKRGWNYRYRVRIIGWNTGDKNILPPDQCIMANVVLSPESGSGIMFGQTPALSAGSLVTGYFLDGLSGQQAFIDGVLMNANNDVPKSRGNSPDSGYDLFHDGYTEGPPETATLVPDFYITSGKTWQAQ